MMDASVSLILVDPGGGVGGGGGGVGGGGGGVEAGGVVVDPAGVAVWPQPTQAISIAVTRIMRLSRCMRDSPVVVIMRRCARKACLSPECASSERGGLAAKCGCHGRCVIWAARDGYVLGDR